MVTILIFCPGHHTNSLRLWKMALQQLAPGGRRATRLRDFVEQGHKLWEWSFDSEVGVVLRHVGMGREVELHIKDKELTAQHRNVRYSPNGMVYQSHQSPPCSIHAYTDGRIQVQYVANIPRAQLVPLSFLDVLKEWGCTWLWEDMQMTGCTGRGVDLHEADGSSWIAEAIQDNYLVEVEDGLYIREICMHLCLAAVVMECTNG